MTMPGAARKIEVLVVEDSRAMREYLVYILESDPQLHVIDAVGDGEAAVASVHAREPDVILMDINLPGIDGLEATRRIMSSRPVPIVMCTATVRFDDVRTVVAAVGAGALAVLKKPHGLTDARAAADSAMLIKTLKLMAEVRVVRRRNRAAEEPTAINSPATPRARRRDRTARDVAIVAIGASTGGPPALAAILTGLPADFPAPILVVQHITNGFTEGLSEWLAASTGKPVHVARTGEIPLRGHVYLAPDDAHLRVGPKGELQVSRDGPVKGLRPSVGVLFESVADRFGRDAVGVLLTGMGQDGAAELKLMADRGALTVAQNEDSCVVFGMPAEAIKLGAAAEVLPPQGITDLLVSIVSGGMDRAAHTGPVAR